MDQHPPQRLPDQGDIDAYLPWTVIQVARRWERMLTEVLAPFGLSSLQHGVLIQLAAHPGQTQAELARRVTVRPQSMHHLLDTVIERGWVRRSGGRGSGRRNPIELTPAGAALLAAAWPAVEAAGSAAGLGMDPARAAEVNTELHAFLTPGW